MQHPRLRVFDANDRALLFLRPSKMKSAVFWEGFERIPSGAFQWKEKIDEAFPNSTTQETKGSAKDGAPAKDSKNANTEEVEDHWTQLAVGRVNQIASAKWEKQRENMNELHEEHGTVARFGKDTLEEDFENLFVALVCVFFKLYDENVTGDIKEKIDAKFEWLVEITLVIRTSPQKAKDRYDQMLVEIDKARKGAAVELSGLNKKDLETKLDEKVMDYIKREFKREYDYFMFCLMRLESNTKMVSMFVEIIESRGKWDISIANMRLRHRIVRMALSNLLGATFKDLLYTIRNVLAYFVYGDSMPRKAYVAPNIQGLATFLRFPNVKDGVNQEVSIATLIVDNFNMFDEVIQGISESIALAATGPTLQSIVNELEPNSGVGIRQALQSLGRAYDKIKDTKDLSLKSTLVHYYEHLSFNVQEVANELKKLHLEVNEFGKSLGLDECDRDGVFAFTHNALSVLSEAIRTKDSRTPEALERRKQKAAEQREEKLEVERLRKEGLEKMRRAHSASDDKDTNPESGLDQIWKIARNLKPTPSSKSGGGGGDDDSEWTTDATPSRWNRFAVSGREHRTVVDIGAYWSQGVQGELQHACSRVHNSMCEALAQHKNGVIALAPEVHRRSERPNVMLAAALYFAQAKTL